MSDCESSTSVDSFGCIGNTIKVADGGYVDLLNPDPASIHLSTIASALSKMCRFGGQCPRFYSVAEHCVHAMRLAIEKGWRDCEILSAILLHDAAEAYVGDMVKPLKLLIPEFSKIEERVERAIAMRFGIDFVAWKDVVRTFDMAMLKAEKLAMWPDDKHNWAGFSDVDTFRVDFMFLTHRLAESWFLEAAESVGLK